MLKKLVVDRTLWKEDIIILYLHYESQQLKIFSRVKEILPWLSELCCPQNVIVFGVELFMYFSTFFLDLYFSQYKCNRSLDTSIEKEGKIFFFAFISIYVYTCN